MSHQPSTSVKVPTSATTYTPATQDSDLRSQINILFLREGHSTKIQEHLLHSLDAHSSNWPSAIQSHALALLRSGEVSTFPALVRRVLEDVRRDTAVASSSAPDISASSTTIGNSQPSLSTSTDVAEPGTTKDGVNGATNGVGKTGSSVNGISAGTEGTANLAIPTAVVEAVLKAVKESLDSICEIDEDGSSGG
ncbi:hypothetical protein F4861DRAFT_506276 [Xylaria intraflava]|nr:hypothetical protein F4861DRAFT_506276 [Xylaria intraflava]